MVLLNISTNLFLQQTTVPTKAKVQVAGFSKDQAASIATSFASKASGRKIMENGIVSIRGTSGPNPVYMVSFNREKIMVMILTENRRVFGYVNGRLSANKFRRINRTGRLLFTNDQGWKNYLLRVSKKLGFPGTRITGFKFSRDGDRQREDFSGSVGGCIVDSKGRMICRIALDPQDGAIETFVNDIDRRPISVPTKRN